MTSLLLVGAGHVHMALLARSARLRRAGLRLTLIDPGSFWWGLDAARAAAGALGADALRLPLAARCRALGVRYRGDRAIGLDTRHRRLWLAGGERLSYDRVSIDVGCGHADLRFADARDVDVWHAGAVAELVQLHARLAAVPAQAAPPRVAITGDSPRAVETVAGLSMAPLANRPRLAWYLPGPWPIEGMPRGAARRVLRIIGERGVDVLRDTAIETVNTASVVSRDGRRFAADHLVVAERGVGARFLQATRLPLADQRLRVTARLQSPADARVFAVGACAQGAASRPLAAKDIDRQAQVLAHNLLAAGTQRPLRAWRGGGDRRCCVDLGDGTVIAWSARLWWRARWLARKHRRGAERLRKQCMG